MYLHSDFKIVLYMSDQKTAILETIFKHMANNEPTVQFPEISVLNIHIIWIYAGIVKIYAVL